MNNVEIIYDWPPFTDEETKKTKDVATSYRGKIYSPYGELREDVIVHELVHIKQASYDYDNWIEMCTNDVEFLIEQEIEAYKAQIEYIEKTFGDIKSSIATHSFAKFLSGPKYGNIISFKDALNKLCS